MPHKNNDIMPSILFSKCKCKNRAVVVMVKWSAYLPPLPTIQVRILLTLQSFFLFIVEAKSRK